MVWPAQGTVTSPFGVWRGNHRHEGIDIGMLVSLRVRAVTEGVVQSTGYENGYEGYGKIIMLNLPGPYVALYAHLSVAQVVPGQWLEAGEPIGQAGCTGSCTGTHLHFELRKNGVPIDPFPYLG